MTRDISTLMIGTLSAGRTDQFGREWDQRRPLLLDTVMEGRERASHSRLLQMPAEILANIVDLLSDDNSTLESLALVNSDCRQLARCCQFAEVHFDYSHQARQLLVELARGVLTKPQQPTIAACVRRATFAPLPHYVASHHREIYESIWGETAQSVTREQREALEKEGGEYYMQLRKTSMLAISTMRNLETLVWEDRFSLDRNFFETVTRSTAQHVKLNRTTMDEPWPMGPPLTPTTWPIRSLDLDISLSFSYSDEDEETSDSTGSTHPMTNFFSTLFQLCSPTLESLRWAYMEFRPSTRGPVSLGNNPISFPRLRHLQLEWLELESSAVSSFFSAPLKSLELSQSILARLGAHIPSYGTFRDLESFNVPYLPEESDLCKYVADFVVQHKHVRRLYIYERDTATGSKAHLDRYIIPALTSQDFSNLCSLSLAWGGGSTDDSTKPHDVHVPKAALATIGALVSLEQLCLCAGIRLGWRHQWLVDHNEVRSHFGQLKRLRKLALVRDTYSIPCPGFDVEEYYNFRFEGDQESIDAEDRPELDINENPDLDSRPEGEEMEEDVEDNDFHHQVWERAHRNRMLAQAEEYAAALPKLEWMFCGQRPMGFEQNLESPDTPRKAVPLTRGRDECYTFLESTFRGSSTV
ncbi:hypothetical protein BGZ61DRAFT_468192 [Ilyonectria robusta]|uniref:uncharacterized protein n=1 Tax=Ilyonectria robusta TaxID=1079257 RepID=UPI001E8D5363|nr:uncharacterized protein BGZ61DRAFT_468192 [Ilyonectria robusta]KAH8653041.1 hypothetical protein BGZ61DRAFT_468192 [Ilyonectria robusta]